MSETFSNAPVGQTAIACPLADIAVVLYDPKGEPVANEPVVLRKTGEQDISATTDEEGRVYIDKLMEGKWEVDFPNRRFDEWKLFEGAYEPPPTWLDIQLVDHEGNGLADEPYLVIGPDGATEFEGMLDANGKARVEVGEPGLCKVNFPERHATDWWPMPAATK
jgi:hypothetical protein